MTRRRLPIGIQTFRKVRDDGCYYVDKAAFMHRLGASPSEHYTRAPHPRWNPDRAEDER